MARPEKTLDFIKKTFPRDAKKGAWLTKTPGIGRLIEYLLFEGDKLICLPRDKVVQIGKPVEEQGQMALPSQLVDHFIDLASYHVVMNFCICRRSMPCKDYPIDLGCLFMGDAAKDINPTWGRHVTKEEAKAHIRKCQDAGLIHFIGRSKLDTVWLGIGPGHKLLTVCNCCPCCCITRGLPYMADRFTEKLIKAPGVTLKVTDDCVGCGACTKVCVAQAISLVEGKAVMSGACVGCGRCADKCPKNAIELVVDQARFMEESKAAIAPLVDI